MRTLAFPGRPAAWAALAAACLSACSPEPPAEPAAPAAPPPPAVALPPPPPPVVTEVRVGRIVARKTFTATLAELGVSAAESEALVAALKDVFDFRKLRLGDQLRVSLKDGRLESFEYRANELNEWLVRREGERLVASKRTAELVRTVAVVEVGVETTLYDALVAAGEDPSLAVDAADVLAWDIDFYRDVRRGDRMRVVVEKDLLRGRLWRYGEILAVRYQGGQVGDKRLLRYAPLAGQPTYFDEQGTCAKRPFLKSPLKFVHITSRFGGRKHPLLGYQQNHNGVDFSAEVGTPVWAVADGTVTRAVRGDPAAGTYLFIRHANGFETGYLHLSSFASGVHAGSRVAQKQVVAYTGNTGMSTGPHLHFAMKRGGKYVNPMSQKFPRAEPLAKSELPRFAEQTAQYRAVLDQELIASAGEPLPAP